MPPSGITASREFEIVGAAVKMGRPTSEFLSWPADDQCRAIAWLRESARAEAVVAHEQQRAARAKARRR